MHQIFNNIIEILKTLVQIVFHHRKIFEKCNPYTQKNSLILYHRHHEREAKFLKFSTVQ